MHRAPANRDVRRIKPILDLCISRFNALEKLQDELDRTKSALEDRKAIDRDAREKRKMGEIARRF